MHAYTGERNKPNEIMFPAIRNRTISFFLIIVEKKGKKKKSYANGC